MKIASKKAIIGDVGSGFMRLKDEPNVDLWSSDSESETEHQPVDEELFRVGPPPNDFKGKGTSGGFPALGKGNSKTKDEPEKGKSSKEEKGKTSNEPGWSVREVPPEEVQHLQPPDPAETVWQRLNRENAADREQARVKRLEEEAKQKEAAEKAEQERNKGKGQTKTARPPEPWRQRRQYATPAPWTQPPVADKGKGGKAPKLLPTAKTRPTSPAPAPINQQDYPPVARPSRQKLAERRRLPAHLLEGKGHKAASSSDTVPVHSQTAAKAKAEITATYGDFALKTVLQHLTNVFDPKGRRARDTSPMDQIAELVLDEGLDWKMVEAMLENAVDDENAFRSDQSLSSRGRTEKKQRRSRRRQSREKRSSSSKASTKRGAGVGKRRKQRESPCSNKLLAQTLESSPQTSEVATTTRTTRQQIP